jgi:hypothetical protein
MLKIFVKCSSFIPAFPGAICQYFDVPVTIFNILLLLAIYMCVCVCVCVCVLCLKCVLSIVTYCSCLVTCSRYAVLWMVYLCCLTMLWRCPGVSSEYVFPFRIFRFRLPHLSVCGSSHSSKSESLELTTECPIRGRRSCRKVCGNGVQIP